MIVRARSRPMWSPVVPFLLRPCEDAHAFAQETPMTSRNLIVLLTAVAAVAALPSPVLGDTTPELPDLASSRTFDPKGWTELGNKVVTGRSTSAVVTLSGKTFDQLALVV